MTRGSCHWRLALRLAPRAAVAGALLSAPLALSAHPPAALDARHLAGPERQHAPALFGGLHAQDSASAEAGIIRGRVRLAVAGPPNPPIRMGADPACAQQYSGERPLQPFVARDADGGLANVFVHLRGEFPDAPAASSSPVLIEQRGCVYLPHVVGVRVGQTLEIRNGDPTAHNVHGVSAAGNGFNVTQPRGGPASIVPMRQAELMLRLTCDVHSWMHVFVGVMRHPYFAVTGSDGQFEIAGVPTGTYTVEAWHERFGPLTATVTVAAGAPATADFGYQGTERPAVPVATVEPFALRLAF